MSDIDEPIEGQDGGVVALHVLRGPGTADDAIAFILENPNSNAAREPVAFLRQWANGDALGFTGYYAWLTARRDHEKLTEAGKRSEQTKKIVRVQSLFLVAGIAAILGGGVAAALGNSTLAVLLGLSGFALIAMMTVSSLWLATEVRR